MKKFVTINLRPPNHTTQLATFVLSRSPLSPLAFTCCLPSFLIFFIISIHALASLLFPPPHTHTHTHTHTHIKETQRVSKSNQRSRQPHPFLLQPANQGDETRQHAPQASLTCPSR